MGQQRLLEGEVIGNGNAAGDASEVQRLRELNRNLTHELSEALEENESLRKQVASAGAPLARLREKLEPFYKLLQALFGDIEELAPDDAGSSEAARHPDAHSPIWESWKKKLGGQCAKIIDVLLVHQEMNTTQLAIAIQTNRRNIPNLIYKMNQAGIINKNGGRFSLKSLA